MKLLLDTDGLYLWDEDGGNVVVHGRYTPHVQVVIQRADIAAVSDALQQTQGTCGSARARTTDWRSSTTRRSSSEKTASASGACAAVEWLAYPRWRGTDR